MYNYIWFRSDLRVIDNPALSQAVRSATDFKIRAVFYVTLKQWQMHNWGNNKIAFMLQALIELQKDLAKLNIELIVRYCDTFAESVVDLAAYLSEHECARLYYNAEYELNENIRDNAVNKKLAALKIQVVKLHSQCLIEPGVILNKQNTPYTVYTPFKKACYEFLYKNPIKLIPEIRPLDVAPVKISELSKECKDYLRNSILQYWPTDSKSIAKRLNNFCTQKIYKYKEMRDYPALAATSTLSPYLACGRISVQQCYIAALACNGNEFASGDPNVTCWISELLWRDFYKHIMFHYPDLCKGKNFNRKYDNLKWTKSKRHLELWQKGETGIPIIDAAMRQLIQTGWMHNRLRMVVAMFLTKNLLIDWRHGEKFFSEHLVDLDLAANNGGWQWSASTGTDAVPYFRIFNPITQSEKFDPQGVFIRQYCPELATVPLKTIHDPSAYFTQLDLQMLGYPERMVDVAKSRQYALSYFKDALKGR